MIRHQLLVVFIAIVAIAFIIYRRHFREKNGEEKPDEEQDRRKP